MTETYMTGLLFQLADLGVTGIMATYSGGGGDGQLDDVVYTTDKLDEDPKRAINEIDSIDLYTPRPNYLIDLDTELYDKMYDFLHNTILESFDVPNWWRDDGGYGHISILIPSGQYTIVNTIYITDTDTSVHNGDLLSKTRD